MLENGTFNRFGTNHKISANTYNFILGAVLMWGFFVNWYLVVTVPAEIVRARPHDAVLGWLHDHSVSGCRNHLQI